MQILQLWVKKVCSMSSLDIVFGNSESRPEWQELKYQTGDDGIVKLDIWPITD